MNESLYSSLKVYDALSPFVESPGLTPPRRPMLFENCSGCPSSGDVHKPPWPTVSTNRTIPLSHVCPSTLSPTTAIPASEPSAPPTHLDACGIQTRRTVRVNVPAFMRQK
jgi:hypothetical protein